MWTLAAATQGWPRSGAGQENHPGGPANEDHGPGETWRCPTIYCSYPQFINRDIDGDLMVINPLVMEY